MRSEADMARQGKLKHHDGSEVNAMAAKTSVKTSLPNLHNKQYIPILDFAFPSDLGGNPCTPHSQSQ